MATIIEQKPMYSQFPVGQDVIFTVSNSAIVLVELKVKFIARVYISDDTIVTASSTPIGTFKTTPNNAGVGMFDFRAIIESFVKADNIAALDSEYKTMGTTSVNNHSIHLIDKYSKNTNSIRFLKVEFGIEYLGATDCAGNQDANVVREQCNEEQASSQFSVFNGYLKHTDTLNLSNSDFGFYIQKFNLYLNNDKLLTNAPDVQYANIDDYGTFSFLANNNNVDNFSLSYYDGDGNLLDSEEVDKVITNGAGAWDSKSENHLLHFGCFPANLQNWSAKFQALVSAGTIQGGSISVIAYKANGNQICKEYTININCPTLKGYEPLRLTWLNQWGVWDYYTFNMKSTRTISTKGSTYQQLAGSWNESTYRIDSFRGGKKSFRVNATEKITMNTDFVSEAESEWFEELINSPEVYILEGYKDIYEVPSALNTYVTPARLTTSSFVRKTVANDKLMQYTFEVEKSKTLRTQSV
tara:strand:+ start:2018 stop:3424 length:1407 start_codon:yes stop_codon:yes gene_type:complete